MENIHIEYTLTVKAEDGSEVLLHRERVIASEHGTDAHVAQAYLEKEFRDTEQAAFVTAMTTQLGKAIVGTTISVTNVSKLVPTGDDDQM